MTAQQKAQVQELLERLIDRVQPEKVVLFGSYANNTATAESDIDLLVVLESELSRNRRQEAISRALRPRRVPLDILAYTPEEVDRCMEISTSFVRHILMTGKVVYDRHGQ